MPRWLEMLIILLCVVLLAALLTWVGVGRAAAHMHDRPDLTDWLRTLYSVDRGGCCDSTDAETMADLNWKTISEDAKHECLPSGARGGSETPSMLEPAYCVLLQNPQNKQWGWWIVPKAALVEVSPNRAGPALIWMFWGAEDKPYIRCFLPGTLT